MSAQPGRGIITPLPANINKDGADFHNRLCRFSREVAAVVNSLAIAGVITITGSGGAPFDMANLLFTGDGPPAAGLGFVGDYYLDLLTGKLYQNQ